MILSFLRTIKLSYFKYKFRLKNSHNRTYPKSNFPMASVSVGKGTYGPLKVIWMSGKETKLSIGNYCSIGPEVTFLVGGEHNYKRISTYPFQTFVYNEKTIDRKNNDIVIEDDVWIGFGVLIMFGVKVGKGSVIGARSIVTKDVPPYSIFVGNKVIKKRFPDVVIDKLLDLDFNTIAHKKGDLYQSYCQNEVDADNVDNIINKFKK